MYYKDIVLDSLEEKNKDDIFKEGIILSMVSPALFRNETMSKFLNKIDENFIEFILDISRTQNLIRPSVKEEYT